MRRIRALNGIRVSVIVALVLATFTSFMPQAAHAAGVLGSTMIRLGNMGASATGVTGTVCVKPTTSSTTNDKVDVTFPSGFTVSTTLANWTTSVSPSGAGSLYWPSGATNWPSALSTASSVSGQTVEWTFAAAQNATNFAPGTLYCFDWTATASSPLTNPTAGVDLQASVSTKNTAGTVLDTGNVGLTIVSSDQIAVSATVPPIFEFTMPSNSDPFTANLSPSSVITTTGVTPTIKTNAKGGWIMWAYDQYQGLHSTAAGYTIPTVGWNSNAPTTLTAGTAAYAMDVTTHAGSGPCTPAVQAEYAGSTTSGGSLLSNWEQIGQCPSNPSNADGLTLTEEAAISVTTPAGTDYTDTVYVVGAGLF
jgi:hypothetical protein